MSADEDLLKVLNKLSRLIDQAAGMTAPAAPKIGGGKKESDRDQTKHKNRIQATATAIESLGKSAAGVTRKFNTLEQTLTATIGQFRTLNDSINPKTRPKIFRVAKTPLEIPDVKPSPKNVSPEIDVLPIVQQFDRLNSALGNTTARVNGLGEHLSKLVIPDGKDKPAQLTVPPVQPVPDKTAGAQGLSAALAALAKKTNASLPGTPPPSPPPPGLTKLPSEFDKLRNRSAKLSTAFDTLYKITDDFYSLQRRGISGSNDLAGLYKNAVFAGMSLREYTEMLDENQAALVRATDFSTFNKSLEKTSKGLATLGIFGPSAMQLSAAMQTAAVTIGIPQAQMADATTSQVKLFAQLRKSTLMTSDAFKHLVDEISKNQNVQEELLGIAPAERRARMDNIMKTATLGQKMGLTRDASDALTRALLDQRKATAKDRFRAAGVIRQAGSMTGMNAQDTEELARLAQKKNKTDKENLRVQELHGQMQERLQGMQNSGDIGAQNIADQIDELIRGSSQGQVAESSARAQLQKQAGGIENTGIGADTGPMAQMLGSIMTTLTGITKNPLYDGAKSLADGAKSLAETLVQTFFLRKIAKNTDPGNNQGGGIFDFFKKRDKLPDPGKTPPSPLGNKPLVGQRPTPKPAPRPTPSMTHPMPGIGTPFPMAGKLGKVPGLGGAAATLASAVSGDLSGVAGTLIDTVISSTATTAPTAIAAEGAVAAKGGAMSKTLNMLKTFVGGNLAGIFGKALNFTGIFGGVMGAVEEMFTGTLGSAFGNADVSTDFEMDKLGGLLRVGSWVITKVENMKNAFLRGIFTTFTGMADWLFKGLGIDLPDLIGGTFTNLFDKSFTMLAAGWDGVKSYFFDKAKGLFKWMGLDSFSGVFGKWSAEADKAQETKFQTFDKLAADGTATLTSIGADAQKQAEDTKKAGKKITTGVAASTKELIAQARKTTVEVQTAMQPAPIKSTATSTAPPEKQEPMRATGTAVSATPPEIPVVQITIPPVKDKKEQTGASAALEKTNPLKLSQLAAIAAPGRAERPNVTQPEINKTQDDSNSGPENEKKVLTVAGMKEALDLLKKQLDIAQRMLDAANKDSAPASFTRGLTPVFSDTTELTRRAI